MLELETKPEYVQTIPTAKLLKQGQLVRFSGEFPSNLTQSGKTYEITAASQVPYKLNFILPANDYRDVDLSNTDEGEKLYPYKSETLYEILLGLRGQNLLVIFYCPSTRYVYDLEYTGMYPDTSNVKKRFLGSRKPIDSPLDDPKIRLYFVKNATALTLRCYIQPGVDYSQISLGFLVNKLKLNEITTPTEEQLRKARFIEWYEKLFW